MWTEGQTDKTRLIVAFLNFANYVLPTPFIYAFSTDPRTNSDYFPTQHCFTTEMECVYCAVRTEYLNVIQCIFVLNGLNKTT
jgi:hypothetical protein